MSELLTDAEREFIGELGKLWGKFCELVGGDVTRSDDCGEAVLHIHALQQAVMSQAAGRAYPTEFRLLGGTLKPRPPMPVVSQQAVAARVAELDAEEREQVAHWIGEGALEANDRADVIPGPAGARCGCGHHLNQHNGMTVVDTIMGPVTEAQGYCVACDCKEFDATPARAEPITPSYTEAEWVEVLAAWLATKRTTLIGRAWPTTSEEERFTAAGEIAHWLLEAAGETLEG